MDLNKKIFTTEVAGRTLTVEVSNLASQANASCLVKYGQTIILATAVMGGVDKEGDFFPLMVNYEEKFYAAGKIIGSRFMRREGKSSDDAVLSSRLIDRSIRPLFDQRLRREVQIVTTPFSIDEENDPEFVALLGASIALAISDIPWSGPVAGVSVANINNEIQINPTFQTLKQNENNTTFNAFFSGLKDKINMIEVAGSEASEADIIKGAEIALEEISKLIDFQNNIVQAIGKPKTNVAIFSPSPDMEKFVKEFLASKVDEAIYSKDKQIHSQNLNNLKVKLDEALIEANFSDSDVSKSYIIFEEVIDKAVHNGVLQNNRRVDDRKLDEIRPLYAEAGLFERNHGTGLFVRGDTQALAFTTLAAPSQEKLEETMEETNKKRFFLHYNFPPYSVGEIAPFRGPGRREIGHGALAEKALKPMIPDSHEFPYTIRIVSEILGSNGSSSMATVCAGTLSLMDAGVPIKKPVAGIAMGIMTGNNGDYKILTDIQGPEDHYGDMDFKVAGTSDGVTAIQLDIKINGVTLDMLKDGLSQAKKARLEILKVITDTLNSPRPALSKYAPSIEIIKINPEKIGELIGPGGKNINAIIDRTGATIDIEDDGTVFVSSHSSESLQKAITEIKMITKEFEVGEIVKGEIVRLMEFGAIVDLGGGKDGMVHVSEIKEGFVKDPSDILKLGDTIKAKVIKVENGKIGLSIKSLLNNK
ncbi:MAG: polyribonucleotide nucleotidyltransferase [Candidatus Liptonbacteria bacterium CG11_big_fil_rev_8_21_14_0_20_35_14]|uniref:Polyribonucleotide nucleotidyltransferase n=1 Tax=Candidatus Liptonbacteria bacterium CG11_big_fil_rev_8_21_14_0_20_35_14 TaxID=1974634 RepID=A0A2H0N8G3_9BACT|nr:MAG: polyribonucleotide nucleotidyltransferase [Candidatus Liptonbacteria bacterium CG11_big_fil_rev_8_21_14_0_20_35_14]